MRNASILCMLLAISLSGPAAGQKISVATYNIRQDNKTDIVKGDGWERRGPVIASMILYHDFDIFGAQEVFNNQLKWMLENLPGYAAIGVGRDDGDKEGEYSPVFYKTERFRLEDSGHFWLSEQTGYPNKGWDASYVRICTWGKFTETGSGSPLWFFTVHTDHRGKVSQVESSRLILSKIEQMCGDDPVVVTGDFNASETSECYRILSESGIVRDVYDLADIKYAHTGTENYFDPDVKTFRRIDHIFVSDHFSVSRYGILTDTYRSEQKMDDYTKYRARTPSDHFPVKADIHFKTRKNQN